MHSPKKGSQAVRAGWWRFCCFCHPSRLSELPNSVRQTDPRPFLSYFPKTAVQDRSPHVTPVTLAAMRSCLRHRPPCSPRPLPWPRCLHPCLRAHAFRSRCAMSHARTRTMMQSCASAVKLRSGGPILPFGVRAKGRLGSATSNRHRRPVTSVRTSQNCRGAFDAAYEKSRRSKPVKALYPGG